MKATIAAAILAALATQVSAVSEWGQCGGKNYSGSTTCDSGLTCVFSNDYYSQCLRTTSSAATSSTKTSSTSSTSSTRASSTSSTKTTSGSAQASSTGPVPTASGNPYSGKSVWNSEYYASEVYAAAAMVTDTALKAKISKVASIPTFTWFDTMAKVADLPGYLQAAGSSILQIVVYDLPNRDCHANASNGELLYANNGAALYQQYIDGITAAIKASSGSTVVAVIEPDSLANLVTNLSDSRCSSVQDQYKASVVYALKTLATAGVYMYIDAGHAGWLGWPANISPAATMFTQIFKSAGSSPFIRGLATNVANYNALTAASPDPVTQGNNNYDETHYINALGPMLASSGWNAQFIVDQGRSGKQNIRSAWGNWCNIKNAGFGLRPTTSTGNSYIDAIVWIKPGGECDGTSNTSAVRYDPMCGGPDAKIPAPEAGQWFQAYFVDLVTNANPAF